MRGRTMMQCTVAQRNAHAAQHNVAFSRHVRPESVFERTQGGRETFLIGLSVLVPIAGFHARYTLLAVFGQACLGRPRRVGADERRVSSPLSWSWKVMGHRWEAIVVRGHMDLRLERLNRKKAVEGHDVVAYHIHETTWAIISTNLHHMYLSMSMSRLYI